MRSLLLSALALLPGCKLSVVFTSDPQASSPQVEATGPVVERSRTYGPVPNGWAQYGTDPQSGMKLVERVRQ